MKILDYKTIENSGEWQVWTPDESGAVIGAGAAKTTALRDAIERLKNAAIMIQAELEAITQ